MINLMINGQNLEVPAGTTVLQAAESIGIVIPTLCYHKDLSPFGGCRLCVVEVEGSRLPMVSCILPVNPGMKIQTESPSLTNFRRTILQMLISNYYDAAYKRYNGHFDLEQDSELAHWAKVYDVDIRSNMAKKPEFPIDSDPNPFVWVDMNKCIQCMRCVRACAEIQGRFVWSQSFRGYQSRIVAGADTTMLQARCESCGACVAYCPTGALDNKMSVNAGRADRKVRTTCTYCGVGCQLDLNIKDDVPGGRVFRVTSITDPSVDSFNGMHLCVKGRYGYEFIHDVRRHTRPRVRQYLLDGSTRPANRGKWVEVDWETAIQAAAEGFQSVMETHGSNKIGILASGKCLNEESYLLNKLSRQILRSNNLDCSSRIYSSSVVEGLLASLGIPAMSNTFQDIVDNAASLFVIGSNLTEQHPVFGARIRQAVLRRKVKMVVANPDFINLVEYAVMPLYYNPRTETALLNGLMHIILEKGWENKQFVKKHQKGYAEFIKTIDRYPPQLVSEVTGIASDSLYQAAEILAKIKPMAVIWSLGVADIVAGSSNIASLANLQMLLGNLDIPGGGVNPLRSQNNLQGSDDMGNIPNMLPGYQDVFDEAVRAKFEQAWGASLPSQPGMKASEILASVQKGDVKALYILGEDLVKDSPEANNVRHNLESCEFIVLQEPSSSDTSRYADILLPSVSFAEKTGTFTNTERRIQMVNQAIQPIGEARPDWVIISDLARQIVDGNENMARSATHSEWNYENTEQIMQEIAALTPIYSGVSHARLNQEGLLSWPADSIEQPGSSILSSGYFSSGRVQWTAVEQMPLIPQEESSSVLVG